VTPDQVYHVFAGEPTGNRVGEKRAAFLLKERVSVHSEPLNEKI